MEKIRHVLNFNITLIKLTFPELPYIPLIKLTFRKKKKKEKKKSIFTSTFSKKGFLNNFL